MTRTPSGARRRIVARALPLFFCACVTPEARAVRDPREAVLARRPDPARAAEVLALADLPSLGLALPTPGRALAPDEDAFWHVAAWAWSPEVRAARRVASAALAREDTAGAPGPIQAQATDHELDGGDPLVEAALTFDLLGWLGLGPVAAERESARADALLAIADLEERAWRAPLAVDRARVRLAAARARVDLLEALHAAAAASGGARIAVLERRGRLSKSAAQAADARLHAVEHRASRARDAVYEAARELAVAAGLPPEHAALACPGGAWLAEVARTAELGGPPDDAPLDAARHPRLRAARLALAAAEARVRVAARGAWPSLRLGPHLAFPTGTTDGVRVGGLASVGLPVPSAWRGPLDVAVEQRERAYEAYDEAWLDQHARLASATQRVREALARRAEHVAPLDRATADAWSSAHARFRVGEGSAEEWGRALIERADALLVLVDEDERLALAVLDRTEARGPRTEVTP